MKTNELRIGNLIEYSGKNFKVKEMGSYYIRDARF